MGMVFALIVLAVWCLLPAQVVRADTITVTLTTPDDGTAGTLREAIGRANDGDTIVITATGTIALTDELTVTDDITITGPGVTNLAIDAGGGSRVFEIVAGSAVTISDLTIQNGAAPATEYGGGINNLGTLRLHNCVLESNAATRGGGIYSYGGTLIVTGSVITNSSTTQFGAGIYIRNATAHITESMIMNNIAETGAGGIYVYADTGPALLTMEDTIIKGNEASGTYDTQGGGGLRVSAANGRIATVTANRCVIEENISRNQEGGGIQIRDTGATGLTVVELTECVIRNNVVEGDTDYGGGIYSTGKLTLSRSSVYSNTAGGGGGIYILATDNNADLRMVDSAIYDNDAISDIVTGIGGGGGLGVGAAGTWAATAMISNSTFSGNTANKSGGGYWGYITNTATVTTTFVNCTFSDNTADADGTDNGDGGGLFSSGTGITVALQNTLVAGNSDGTGQYPDLSGAFLSRDYNLLRDITGVTIHGVTTHNITGQDPLLGILADNGGDTWTHTPLYGSPAVGAIPPVSCTLVTDQRGVARPQDVNCDIGAVEVGEDLRVIKQAAPGMNIYPGDRVTYTLTFSNTGAYTATHVVLTDIIPIALTGIVSSYSGVLITPTGSITYAWDVQDLPYGQSGMITITGVLSEPLAVGWITNEVTITAATDAATGNNTDTVSFQVQNAAPVASAATYTTDEATVVSGTLAATDANGDALTYGIWEDAITGTVLITDVTTGAFVYTPTHQTASYTDTFTFVVTDTGSLTDTAVVTVGVTVLPSAVDLVVHKSVSPTSAAVGEMVTYTMVVSNAGLADASGVLISDTLPTNLTFVAGSAALDPPQPGATLAADATDLPTLAAGVTVTGAEKVTLTFQAMVATGLPGLQFTNTVAVTSTEVTIPVTDSVVVTVKQADVDLEISKAAAPEPVNAGETLTYTILITNSGALSATNVTLSDTLSFSTTLQPVDQTDDDGTLLGFGGGTHDNTRWYDPRPNIVNANKWLELVNTNLGTGVYTSRMMDATSFGPWETLEWLPRRPYWKPLPDNGAAEVDYPLGRADMYGNRALLHMDAISYTTYHQTLLLPNGGIVTDTSGANLPVLCSPDEEEFCPSVVTDGRFNQALHFYAPLSQTLVISDPVDASSYALEAWVRPQVVTDTSFILRANMSGTRAISGTEVYVSNLLGIHAGKFIHAMTDEAGRTVVVTSTVAVTADTWYHIVGTGRANGAIRLYVNGVEAVSNRTIGTPWMGGDHYRIGTAYDLTLTQGITGTTQYFTGDLDEMAIYTRTLASLEVQDHYLRGALRLSFQVRSCDDVDCAGEVFIGPGGFVTTTYSELPRTGLGLPSVALTGVADNRYFQYRAMLETDETAYSPEIRSVRVEPEDRAAIMTSQGVCTAVAGDNSLTCDFGDLESGEVITVEMQVDLDPSTLGIITNTVAVTSTAQEVNSSNNTAFVTSTVVGLAHLDVLKYDDGEYANIGSEHRYYIDVLNLGPSTAYSATITDTLSNDLVGYPEGRNGWTCGAEGNTVTCTIASLAVGVDRYDWHRAAVITLTAPITEGLITNTVWLTSSVTPITPTTAITDDEVTMVTVLADLLIEKVAAPDPVNPGETLTYTISVSNTGPMTATGVIVTDTLPTGLVGAPIYDPLLWTTCSVSGLEVSCELSGTLPVLQSASFQITVTAPMSGFLENYAVVTALEQDDYEDNNEVTIYSAVRPVADLSISKRDDPDPVYADAPLTYTLTVTNVGPVPAGQVAHSYTFESNGRLGIPAPRDTAWRYPAQLRLNSVVGTIHNITVTLRELEYDYPSDLSVLLVGPGGQNVMLIEGAGGGVPIDDVSLTFNDSAAQSLPVSGTLVTGVYRPTSYDAGFNQDLEPPAPARPYGSSLLSAFEGTDPNGTWSLYLFDNVPESDGGYLNRGWMLTITVMTEDVIVVSDTLPSELSGASITGPQAWMCGLAGDEATCEATYFGVGQPAEFVINATTPVVGGVITNTAAVSSTIADLDLVSNTVSITTTVVPVANLEITKQVDPQTVGMGYPLTYTLSVSNLGPSDVATVTVVDTLPVSLTNVSVIPAGWACDTAALPVFTCTLDSLVVGTAPDIVVTGDAPMVMGEITNTATVTGTIFDDDVLNNTAEVTATVTERPILSLVAYNESPTFLSDPTTFWAVATPDDGVTYTWLISNTLFYGTPVTYTYPATGTFTVIVTATNSVSEMTATTQVEIVAKAADLAVVKVVDPLTVTLGRPLTYTLVISNAGPDDVVTRITLTDNLPVGLTGIGVTAGVSTTCDMASLPSVVTCTLESLRVGQTTTAVTITATAPVTPGDITNMAHVFSAMVDRQTGNNDVSVTTAVIDEPVMGLAAENDSPTLLGSVTTFTATVTGGTNITYLWNFGNGVTGSGAVTAYTYPLAGTYTAIVTAANTANALSVTTPVTIINIPTVQFSTDMYTVTEDVGSVLISVTLNTAPLVTVTVDYATGAGTATAGQDYTETLGTLTFLPGEMEKTFIVEVHDDALDELDETVILTLRDVAPTAILGTPATATLTIVDNDLPPVLSVDNVSAGESEGAMTFTVSLSEVSGLDVEVDFATHDTTATAPADYISTTQRLLLSAGTLSVTIPVTITDDAIDEENAETFSVTLSTPLYATLGVSVGVGMILDDDTAGVTITPTTVVVAEGGITDTYQVVLESEPVMPVTVTLTPDTQVNVAPVSLHFTAGNWDVPQPVIVTAVDDSILETLLHHGWITHTVESSDINYAGTFTLTVMAVITDNENIAPVAVDDVYMTTEDVVLSIPAEGVLGNDIDTDALTATLDTGPSLGLLRLMANGAFIYTPTLNFYGVVTFTYHASDGVSDSNSALVTITVASENDAPVAINDVYTTTEDILLPISAPGVLENDSDVDNTVLTAILDSGPVNGMLMLAADGSFVYTPTAGFAGADTFTYHANDGAVDSNVATVTIDVVARTRYEIYLPLLMRRYAAAPDLVVDAVTATSTSMVVVLRNQGEKPVEAVEDNEFWVDVYIGLRDPANPPSQVNDIWQDFAQQGFSWGVTASVFPLNPGDVLTLTVNDVYYDPYGEAMVNWPLQVGTDVYVHVDSANNETTYGGVLEDHEIVGTPYNNVYGPVSVTAGMNSILPDTTTRVRKSPSETHLPSRP